MGVTYFYLDKIASGVSLYNVFETLRKISEMSTSFVVATTREGGRGIDYVSKLKTIIIATCHPQSHRELKQRFGRT
jgi:hypothetical protein